MNKRCRLLVTAKCPNNCPLCCNKQFNLFEDIPVIDRWNYDEFIFTGGEPLKFPNELVGLINCIMNVSIYMGTQPKYYLYTSICDPRIWDTFIWKLDGITYTVHTKENAKELIQLIHVLNNTDAGYDSVFPSLCSSINKSLWLNLFPEAKELINEELSMSPYKWDDITRYFKIRQMEWKENCPIPEGEDFRRINNLW